MMNETGFVQIPVEAYNEIHRKAVMYDEIQSRPIAPQDPTHGGIFFLKKDFSGNLELTISEENVARLGADLLKRSVNFNMNQFVQKEISYPMSTTIATKKVEEVAE